MERVFIIDDVTILNEDFNIIISDYYSVKVNEDFSLPVSFEVELYGDINYLSALKRNVILSNSWNPLFCLKKTSELIIKEINGAKEAPVNIISLDGAEIPEKYRNKFDYNLTSVIASEFIYGTSKNGNVFLRKNDWKGSLLFYIGGQVAPYLCLTETAVEKFKEMGIENLVLKEAQWE